MMKVAKINYLNTQPFFFDWNEAEFPLLPGTPRALSQKAREGALLAGPLPIVDCWDLEDQYEPLNQWGIAVRHESQSVIVISKRPFSKLQNVRIGVTKDSSTSVTLLKILIQHKYGHVAEIRRGFDDMDEARLLIGDAALTLWRQNQAVAWPYVTDLANEWWTWHNLPFVFARWVVRKKTDMELRRYLEKQIHHSLTIGQASLELIAGKAGETLQLPKESLLDYLNKFTYIFSEEEKTSIRLFRELARGQVAMLTGSHAWPA